MRRNVESSETLESGTDAAAVPAWEKGDRVRVLSRGRRGASAYTHFGGLIGSVFDPSPDNFRIELDLMPGTPLRFGPQQVERAPALRGGRA